MKKTYIIAEAGVNHNGSLHMAKELIAKAAEAGANAVKFQTFKAAELVTKEAPKAAYQKLNTQVSESQFSMLKNLELAYNDYFILQKEALQRNIEFLSTPFDSQSLHFLCNDLNMFTIKVSSGDITNAPFLLAIARKAKKIILSTGMSTLADIEAALSIIAFGFLHATGNPNAEERSQAFANTEAQSMLREKVAILHCTSEYPAAAEHVNLKAMNTIADAFGLETGYSDHTLGIHIAIAAVARGASIIEKHLTLDNTLAGPDHQASLEPYAFKEMVTAIRETDKALGDGRKKPSPVEWQNRLVARKSLVAADHIRQGEPLKIACKRPGNGISPFEYWNLQSTLAKRDYAIDELLEL